MQTYYIINKYLLKCCQSVITFDDISHACYRLLYKMPVEVWGFRVKIKFTTVSISADGKNSRFSDIIFVDIPITQYKQVITYKKILKCKFEIL